MRGLIRRRSVVQALATGVFMVRTGWSATPMVVAGSTPERSAAFNLLVCGPQGGRIDRWGRAVAQGLASAIAVHQPIGLHAVGGEDGVTGANRLQALVIPDGRTAAILPNAAIIAFLAGDPRVHFQIGDWIPVMSGLNAAVLVVRGGLMRLNDPAPIKLAAASPESADLAAILAFHRLDIATSPVFGLRGMTSVVRAFAGGEADAVLLTGEDISADIAPLAANGGVAIATLGIDDAEGRVIADPQFPELPTVHAIATERRTRPLPNALEAAYRAVAAASRVDFLMVLPHLTTPAQVATWRQAASGAMSAPALQAAAAASSIELTVTGSAGAVAPFDVSSASLLALRAFLFEHFGWRPS
jgi:hypothetical protein